MKPNKEPCICCNRMSACLNRDRLCPLCYYGYGGNAVEIKATKGEMGGIFEYDNRDSV